MSKSFLIVDNILEENEIEFEFQRSEKSLRSEDFRNESEISIDNYLGEHMKHYSEAIFKNNPQKR